VADSIMVLMQDSTVVLDRQVTVPDFEELIALLWVKKLGT